MSRYDSTTETRRLEAERCLRQELKKRYPDLAGSFRVRLTTDPVRSGKVRHEESVDHVDW